MTTIKTTDLTTVSTEIQIARSPNQPPAKLRGDSAIAITQYRPELNSILGESPRHTLLLTSLTSSRNPFFHSGCILQGGSKDLWTTSSPLETREPSALPVILISKVSLSSDSQTPGSINSVSWQKLRPPPTIPMPANGAAYEDGILWAAQGSSSAQSAGLVYLKWGKQPEVIVKDYYGSDFNSPYDVAVAQDGAIWFTDPINRSAAAWRPKSRSPPRIYRFVPENGEIRVMADGLNQPMGLAISPDQSTLYVTESSADMVTQGGLDAGNGAVYAFDIVTRCGSPFLTGQRLFAVPIQGSPTCVRCDKHGNVWVASGNHVEMWSPGAVLLGTIGTSSTVVSLCLGEAKDVFIAAGHSLWLVQTA